MLIVFITNNFIIFLCDEIRTGVFLFGLRRNDAFVQIIKLAEVHFVRVRARAIKYIYAINSTNDYKSDASHLNF